MKLKIKKLISVDSTNIVAIDLIKKNKIKPTLVTADIQKKGKGTMGKKWISKKGNLFVSIYFQISKSKIDFREFSILNPYIIKNIIKKYSKYKINIKWPNDIFIKKKKVCGILQEVIEFKKKQFLIIGIGINTKKTPITRKFNSISLQNCSNTLINNNKILHDLIKSYENLLPQINKYKFSYFKRNICRGWNEIFNRRYW